MDNITILASPGAVSAYLADLRQRGVANLALDLEADQGSYHYRYAIAIFQCFDGRDAIVIDVLALGQKLDALRDLLEAPDITKVMFSSKNDLFITQNVLGCGIAPIRDIAVAQKMLGLQVNLSRQVGIQKSDKDRFQRANWLTRPISAALLEYAIGDVESLLDMEAGLRTRLAERRLTAKYEQACAALPQRDYRIDQYRQYQNKFPGYKRLDADRKEQARLVWIFRELVGEHFDRPVGYMISTKLLPQLLDGDPAMLAVRLEQALNSGRRPDKRISTAFVGEKLARAHAAIAGEPCSIGQDAVRLTVASGTGRK
jgi:ribonuclease D